MWKYVECGSMWIVFYSIRCGVPGLLCGTQIVWFDVDRMRFGIMWIRCDVETLPHNSMYYCVAHNVLLMRFDVMWLCHVHIHIGSLPFPSAVMLHAENGGWVVGCTGVHCTETR